MIFVAIFTNKLIINILIFSKFYCKYLKLKEIIYPRNQYICVQFEQTKQEALLFVQSKPKKVAIDVFNCAFLNQK